MRFISYSSYFKDSVRISEQNVTPNPFTHLLGEVSVFFTYTYLFKTDPLDYIYNDSNTLYGTWSLRNSVSSLVSRLYGSRYAIYTTS